MTHTPNLRISRYATRANSAPRSEVTEARRRRALMETNGQETPFAPDSAAPCNPLPSSIGEGELAAVGRLAVALATASTTVAVLVGRGVTEGATEEEG
jgi:hypothetical protein